MEAPADLPHAKVAAFFAAQKHPIFIGAEVLDIFTAFEKTLQATARR